MKIKDLMELLSKEDPEAELITSEYDDDLDYDRHHKIMGRLTAKELHCNTYEHYGKNVDIIQDFEGFAESLIKTEKKKYLIIR